MLTNDWLYAMKPEFSKPYYKKLYDFMKEEYSSKVIYPPSAEILSAFELTRLSDVKVLILGQDPYHEPGQAHGLSFSVKPGVDIPPSLRNIYKELQSELGLRIPDNGYLVPWARQGVFMLNSVLTVRAHQAFSHRGQGWEQFTDAAIGALDRLERPVVFMLWGKPAAEKEKLITNSRHLVLKAPHPSPLSASRGFFGCGHFERCNRFLTENGIEPIDWQIPDIGGTEV